MKAGGALISIFLIVANINGFGSSSTVQSQTNFNRFSLFPSRIRLNNCGSSRCGSLRLRGGILSEFLSVAPSGFAKDFASILDPKIANSTKISDRQYRRIVRDVTRERKAANRTPFVEEERFQSFRAGRMVVEDNSLKPLPNKGVIVFEVSEEDGMMHLLWMDRNQMAKEQRAALDLILVPGDTGIERVTAWRGRAIRDARVYAVSYNSSCERFHFWMQEPTLEADDIFFNRVWHIVCPLKYESAQPGFGWRWQSHMNLSVALGLQNLLRDSDGRRHDPGLPADPDHPVYAEAAANVSSRHRARWLATARAAETQAALLAQLKGGGAGIAAGKAGKVARPETTPKGGDNWQYWTPSGATRITHWDPVVIRCATPGADIYYKYYENYDEEWEDDEEDGRPIPKKWSKYEGPLMLPRPGLYDEMGHEGWRVKAVAMKAGWETSEVMVCEFAVFIHFQDKVAIEYFDRYEDHDYFFDLLHPATAHLDLKMRRATNAFNRFVTRRLEQYVSGEINATTKLIYPLDQPEELLGIEPWPPVEKAPPPDSFIAEGEAYAREPLPPGAACRDGVTGMPLDDMGFPFQEEPPPGPPGFGPGPGGFGLGGDPFGAPLGMPSARGGRRRRR